MTATKRRVMIVPFIASSFIREAIVLIESILFDPGFSFCFVVLLRLFPRIDDQCSRGREVRWSCGS